MCSSDLADQAKVILSGEIKAKVKLTGIGASAGAKAAIEAAGGSVEAIVVEPRGKLKKKEKSAS